MSEVADFVAAELAAVADPDKAGPMAAYLKTDMPFHGVQKAGRVPVLRAMVKRFPPADRDDYEAKVLALWALPHREEKYAAIHYATKFRKHIGFASLPLYERLVVEGAWWDLVDAVVPYVCVRLYEADAARMTEVAWRWARTDDVWLQRSSLISQLKRKADTDAALLFDLCRHHAPDKRFWVRKAIGWSLREYSRWAPEAVRDFLVAEKAGLSGLSYREGAKRLVREGLM